MASQNPAKLGETICRDSFSTEAVCHGVRLVSKHNRRNASKKLLQESVVGFCRRVENIIKDIPPVLILYTANNAETFLRETYELRGDVWKEQIDSLIGDTPYGKKRNLTGFDGFMEFFNEYVSIVNAVYDELQIAHISIDVTTREWPKVEKQTCEFLAVCRREQGLRQVWPLWHQERRPHGSFIGCRACCAVSASPVAPFGGVQPRYGAA